MAHSLNFLHDAEPAPVKRERATRRWIRTLLVFCFVLVVLWGISLIIASVHVATKSYQAAEQLLTARDDAQDYAFEEAAGSLDEAEALFALAQQGLPVIRTASWVPVYGSSVESVADLIDAGHGAVDVLSDLFMLGEELVRLSGLSESYLQDMQVGLEPKVTFDDLPVKTKRAMLLRLSAASEDLDLFAAQLAIVEEEFALLSRDERIAPLLATLQPLLEQVQVVREQLSLAAVVTKLLPTFGGLEEPSTSLFLFLNNNEIRPGGGFIGSYGVLVMDGGDISTLETADVYTLDDAVAEQVEHVPPYPLTSYNGAEQWFFRDANWSPDFAASSETALQLFAEEAGYLEEGSEVPVAEEVDHVIALTPTFASALLEIVGDITVGGQTFTAENVSELIEWQVQFAFAEDGTPYAQRKEILADLINEMKSRLFSLSSSEWSLVAEAAQEALRTKQLVFYSTDESTQQVLDATGWGGRFAAQEGMDTLFVVDANLASLKSDYAVERETAYELYENASGQWIGRVTITYDHTGDFDWRTTRYRTYARLYTPLGTRLLSHRGSLQNDLSQNPSGAPGSVDQYEEFGMQVFGAFTAVEPGAQQKLVFEFEVAPEIAVLAESGAYKLSVLKQIGALNRALTLNLDFGKTLSRAVPSEDASQWGDEVYRLETVLDQDSIFEVSF